MLTEPLSRPALLDALVSAVHSAPRVARAEMIVGGAGIGKTHLLGKLQTRLARQGLDVVNVIGSIASKEIALASMAGIVSSLILPEGQSQVMAVIRHLTIGRLRTVVLVDNVDRLDPASMFVVVHCVRDARVPVIMTMRDMAQLPEPLRELYDEGAFRHHQLEPLSLDDSLGMAAGLLKGQLTPRAASTLAELAKGNPLYIRELIMGSLSSGVLEKGEHGWEFREPPRGTPRLGQLIGEVFENLDEELIDIAGLLAVSDGLAAPLLDPTGLRSLVRRGIATIDDGGVARLSHPLFAEALYSRSAPALLDSYRGDAFELLRERLTQGDLASRARMVALGVDAGRPVPHVHLLAEAQSAQSEMDHDRAWQLSQIVLAEDPEQAQANWIAGAAASGAGRLEDAEKFLSRAVELAPDERSRAQATRSLAQHIAVRRHEPLRAAALLQSALSSLTNSGEQSRLEHDLLQWQMVGGALGSLPAPPMLKEDASYAHHLAVTLMVSLIVGPLTDAEEKSRKLHEIMPRYRDEVPTGPAIANLGRFMLISYTGDIVAAREIAERFLRLDNGHAEMRGAWEYSLGMIELLSGDIDTAAQLATDSVVHLRWRDPLGLLPAALALCEATGIATGNLAGAAQAAAQIPEFMQADPKVAMLRAWTQAWQERVSGRRVAAAEIIISAAQTLMSLQHVFLAGMLGHCAARAGSADQVLPVLGAAAKAGGGVLELFYDQARASTEENLAKSAELIEIFYALGMVPSALDAMVLVSRHARKRGDVMAARRWERRIEQALSEHPRVALWSYELDSALSLSPRERQVALLANGRLTAREIGEQLGVTEKTVNNQLAAVYKKLGVSGRAELRELLSD